MTGTLVPSTPAPVDPATDHIAGPASAPLTLIEYGDFECPNCSQAFPVLQSMQSRFGNRLRFVFRHFPLREVHPRAEAAAEASEAAAAQGQFWAYHDLLFSHHGHLDDEHLRAHAQALGLDLPRFQSELADAVFRQRVQEHIASGDQAGVRATPTFFLNGRFVDASFGLDHLERAIEAAVHAHGSS